MSTFQVVLEWDPYSKYWVSYVPSLNHISTFGETREAVLAATHEAIAGYLEATRKEGLRSPQSAAQVEVVSIEVGTE